MSDIERQHKQVEVEKGLEDLAFYQGAGRWVAVRAGFANRFDSECRGHADDVSVVLYSTGGRQVRRAEDHAIADGV